MRLHVLRSSSTSACYGLLTFPKSQNVGDAIQAIAASRLLPNVDMLIDRESIHRVPSGRLIKVVGNAWYGHNVENWPPSESVQFLPISMHLSPRAAESFLSKDNIHYLESIAPIGARDLHTLSYFQDHGVPSYFSGCLTLTLRRPRYIAPIGGIVLCDVPQSIEEFVRFNTRKRVDIVTHDESDDTDIVSKMTRASRLLRKYASADAVITTRLHAALPALAMGTPVYLVLAVDDAYRFTGLLDYVRHGTVDEFLSGKDFDINDPTANAETYLDRASDLRERVASFLEL